MDIKLMFAYISAKKEFAIQTIHYISQDEKYIQGIDLLTSQFRTYRKDRIICKFDSAVEASSYNLADNLDHALIVLATTNPRVRNSTPKIDTFDIHFTGFKKADKERLIKLAEEKQLAVRQSVTQNLQLLCVGYNASVNKIQKAQGMGISIMNESDFLNFLETGEILLGE